MVKDILITTEFINLNQFLKFVNLIDSGANAKLFIKNNLIKVNDQFEQRRGRKIYPNDQIIIKNITYIIKKEKRSV